MNFIELIKNKSINILKKLLKNGNLPFNFLKNSLFQKWAIAVFLCLILALIMAPEFHFSELQFKLGMIAPKNIKADYSFLVEDKQAAEQKIIEDAENIKPIYDYDSKIAEIIKTKLLNSFSLSAEIHKSSFKGKISGNNDIDISKLQKEKKSLESNLGVYLSSEEFYILNEYKFSNELQHKFSRLIVSFYENKFITNDAFGKSDRQKGIVARNLQRLFSVI
jgi:membrane-associated HD superfamily phosphohydrolase